MKTVQLDEIDIATICSALEYEIFKVEERIERMKNHGASTVNSEWKLSKLNKLLNELRG